MSMLSGPVLDDRENLNKKIGQCCRVDAFSPSRRRQPRRGDCALLGVTVLPTIGSLSVPAHFRPALERDE